MRVLFLRTSKIYKNKKKQRRIVRSSKNLIFALTTYLLYIGTVIHHTFSDSGMKARSEGKFIDVSRKFTTMQKQQALGFC